MKKLLLIAALACAFVAQANPEDHGRHSDRRRSDSDTRIWLPIGLSIITPPIQLPSPAHTLVGGMVNLGYGQMENIAILDVGLINNVTDSMMGLEIGAVNLAGTCAGAQVGAFNQADRIVGLQVGLINMTGDLHGVQLGVLNFSASGGAWMFPIFNLGF